MAYAAVDAEQMGKWRALDQRCADFGENVLHRVFTQDADGRPALPSEIAGCEGHIGIELEFLGTLLHAEGHANATRAQGEAEAEIIFKKGDAEARAMNVKAEAYQEYNQAAVIDKLITNMPEIVRALAAPLANIDKITIVSTGNGASAGMHKITGDITQMAAQIPALFETLSGMPMSELLSKVRLIGDKPPKPDTDGDSKAKGAGA